MTMDPPDLKNPYSRENKDFLKTEPRDPVPARQPASPRRRWMILVHTAWITLTLAIAGSIGVRVALALGMFGGNDWVRFFVDLGVWLVALLVIGTVGLVVFATWLSQPAARTPKRKSDYDSYR